MLLKGSKYKFRAIVCVSILGVILYSLAPDFYLNRVDTISSATSDDSFAIRLLAWKINLLLAIKHPTLGVGLYGCLNYANWISEMPVARNWLFKSPLVLRSFVAHSIYFQALGDTGFVGAALFVTILLVSLFKLNQAEKIVRGNPNLVWLGELARALKLSVVVYMISGAALSLLYFEPLYIVLALGSRVHRIARQEAVKKRSNSDAQRSTALSAPGRMISRPVAVS